MIKIYLTGNETINTEIRDFLKDKAGFIDSPGNADLIIDSLGFPAEKKQENIKFIDENFPSQIPVLTSSLCIPVSVQCTYSKYPERLIGAGLYSTFSKSGKIEIAPSKITGKAVLKNAEKLLESLGIRFSAVPDRAGMIFPRIISMIINEAVQVYSENTASREDIDTAMKLGTNYPYGPLEWADKLGIDLVYNILISLQRDFGEDRYRPHPALKEMTDLKLNFYGKK